MTTSKGPAGIHRVKRNVDRRWLKHQLDERGFTLATFASALARETHREAPLDKASIHRRIQGKIPFTALEAEALAHMFSTPIETVLAKIGGAASDPPMVGTIGAVGNADVKAVAIHSASLQRLVLDTRDGWNGAIVFASVHSIPASSAGRGLYLATLANGETRVLQVIGATGGILLTASMFGDSTASVAFSEIKELRRLAKIELPE